MADQTDKVQTAADLRALQRALTCETLKSKVADALRLVTVALVKQTDTPDQIRTAQIELRRIGCYGGPATGAMNDLTRRALDRFAQERKLVSDIAVDAELLLVLRAAPGAVCRAADTTAAVADPISSRTRPSGGPACGALIEKGQLMELDASERDFLRSKC